MGILHFFEFKLLLAHVILVVFSEYWVFKKLFVVIVHCRSRAPWKRFEAPRRGQLAQSLMHICEYSLCLSYFSKNNKKCCRPKWTIHIYSCCFVAKRRNFCKVLQGIGGRNMSNTRSDWIRLQRQTHKICKITNADQRTHKLLRPSLLPEEKNKVRVLYILYCVELIL